MTLHAALGLAFLLLGPLLVGVAVAVIVDAWLNLRDVHRTGHVSACLAPRGWRCTCPSP